MENDLFVNHVRTSFMQFLCQPGSSYGVPPKSLGQRDFQHTSISSTTSDYPSQDNCSNTDKSLSNRCNHQLLKSSTSRSLSQPSSSLSPRCHENMFKIDPERLSTKKIATNASLPVTGSHQPIVHSTGISPFNLNHRLETGLMEAKVISHRDMMPSVNEISLATGSLSFMEENLLSICGSRTQEPGNGIKASVEGLFQEFDSYCLHPKFAALESANDHGRFISAANCTMENIKSFSPVASDANPQSISQDINPSSGRQGILRSSQENSSPMSSSVHLKQNISSDLPSSSGYGVVQSTVGGNLVIDGAISYSNHSLNAKKGQCLGVEIDTIFTQSPNEKSSTYQLPLAAFGDDLFEAFGVYGSLDRELPFDSQSSLDVDSCNTQPNLPPIFYSVIDNNLSTTEIFSESNTDQLLDAVISKVNQGTRQSLDESTSCKTSATQVCGSSSNDRSTSSGKKHGDYISPSMVTSNSEAAASTSMKSADSIDQTERFDETSKVNRKRPRPGETPRPRPKDRQLIMDRIKELREIVPNGAKCSIDALMEKTIKHMIFLQSVAKHADKLRDSSEPKIISKNGGVLLKDNFQGGATWAFEVGSQPMTCPIIVEDLNPPREMLVEMLCEERGFFLEIADLIRGLGLTILKGVMEARKDKVWARFAVEANRDVTRMEIFLSLVRSLEPTIGGGAPRHSAINNKMQRKIFDPACVPVSGASDPL